MALGPDQTLLMLSVAEGVGEASPRGTLGVQTTAAGGTPVTDEDQVVQAWLTSFEAALESGEFPGAASLLHPDGYWRDLLALTWNLRTFHGTSAVQAGLAHAASASQARRFRLRGEAMSGRLGEFGRTVEAFFTFETDAAHCSGFVRLIPGSVQRLGDGDGSDMTHGAGAGREIMDGVGIAAGRNAHGQRDAQRRRAEDIAPVPIPPISGQSRCGYAFTTAIEPGNQP